MCSFRSPRLFAVLLACLVCAPPVIHAQQASFPFQDPTLPLDARVDDLVARMTLEEKASQLAHRTRAIDGSSRAPDHVAGSQSFERRNAFGQCR